MYLYIDIDIYTNLLGTPVQLLINANVISESHDMYN